MNLVRLAAISKLDLFLFSTGSITKDNLEEFALRRLEGDELAETTRHFFGAGQSEHLDNLVFTNGPIILNIPHAVHHEDLRAAGERFSF